MPLTEIYIDLYTGMHDGSSNIAPEHRARRRINLRSDQSGINEGVRQTLHELLDKNIDELNKEMKK